MFQVDSQMASAFTKLILGNWKIVPTYKQAEFRGADFLPVEIFPKPNRDSDSVKNSESHDIKCLT